MNVVGHDAPNLHNDDQIKRLRGELEMLKQASDELERAIRNTRQALQIMELFREIYGPDHAG